MRSLVWSANIVMWIAISGGLAGGQLLQPTAPQPGATPTGSVLTNPGLTPQDQFLYDLEAKFAADTAKGGGKAFGSWFAPDAVTLANGEAPVLGHDAIAARATWTPEAYQLRWTPEGARMSPGGDMGFTWGHYEGDSKDAQGHPVKKTGRYMTVWKKQPDGSWKVEMDASNEGPPEDCCRLK
ncbi:MAG TPA: nuclear transport factor 2 family protein [Acidobacteriaceae bacterium]|nr:nuclear transport factor 2 family protein [Acidobacteriaceae bacterium]